MVLPCKHTKVIKKFHLLLQLLKGAWFLTWTYKKLWADSCAHARIAVLERLAWLPPMVASPFWVFKMSCSLKLCFWPFSDSMEKLDTYTCLYGSMGFSDRVHIHTLDPQLVQLATYSQKTPTGSWPTRTCLEQAPLISSTLTELLLSIGKAGFSALCFLNANHQIREQLASLILGFACCLVILESLNESLLHPQNTVACCSGHFVCLGVQIPQAEEEIEFTFPTHWQNILITELLH